jgi:hypothetical protein
MAGIDNKEEQPPQAAINYKPNKEQNEKMIAAMIKVHEEMNVADRLLGELLKAGVVELTHGTVRIK